MRWEVHWARLFITLSVLTLGGGSLVAALTGKRPPCLSGDDVSNEQIMAVILAQLVVFCIPNGHQVVGFAPTRFVWQTVGALNIAYSVRAGMASAPATSSDAVVIIYAVAQATGGALIAEYLNLLLL